MTAAAELNAAVFARFFMDTFFPENINFIFDFLNIVIDYIPTLLIAILAFLIGSLINRLVLHFAAKAIEKSRLEKTAASFILRAVKAAAVSLVVVIALSIAGVPMNSIIAVIASVGVAVGVSMKESLSNVTACLLILHGKLFRVGDFIEVAGAAGTVVEIHIFSVKLITPDNRILFIPNSTVTTNVLTNYSVEPTRRFEIIIKLDISKDFETAREAIKAVLEDDIRVEKHSIHVKLSNLTPHFREITVRGVTSSEEFFHVKADILEGIDRAINK
jgi:small conductance mechanosensitive channel